MAEPDALVGNTRTWDTNSIAAPPQMPMRKMPSQKFNGPCAGVEREKPMTEGERRKDLRTITKREVMLVLVGHK